MAGERELHAGGNRAFVLVTMLGLAAVALVLHGANVVYLLNAAGCDAPLLACPAVNGAWATNDTESFLNVAWEILVGGPLSATYVSRSPGLPSLLAAAMALTGQPTPAVWAAPVFAAMAAAATGWLGWALAGSRAVMIGSGLLYLAWPVLYQFAPLLMSDADHAFLVVAATAATWHWRNDQHPATAVGAALLWAAAQALRPTFLALPLILPVLLWKRSAGRRYTAASALLWLSGWVVPLLLVTSNTQHGVRSASASLPETVTCYALPRVQEQMGLGRFADLREECFRRYEDMDIGARVAAQNDLAATFVRSYPVAFGASLAGEALDQMLTGHKPYYFDRAAALYPAFLSWPGAAFMALYWLCAMGGIARAARRPELRSLAAFTLLAAGLVMVPAALSHWVGARLRLPVDLLCMPFVIFFLASLRRTGRKDDSVRLSRPCQP
jgi:hypothetical protein